MRNLDLQIEKTIAEGVTILKRYGDLHFYLTKIGFDKRIPYQVAQLTKSFV